MSFRRYCFPRADISQIHRHYRGLSYGLQIEHTRRDIPPVIQFWPRDVEEFEQALDANPFPITKPSGEPIDEANSESLREQAGPMTKYVQLV